MCTYVHYAHSQFTTSPDLTEKGTLASEFARRSWQFTQISESHRISQSGWLSICNYIVWIYIYIYIWNLAGNVAPRWTVPPPYQLVVSSFGKIRCQVRKSYPIRATTFMKIGQRKWQRWMKPVKWWELTWSRGFLVWVYDHFEWK